MKTLEKLSLSFGVAFILTAFVAEINYKTAIRCASLTDGTDGQIEAVLKSHGFEVDIFEPIQNSEKFKALINLL